jgi:predicted nuclease of restriction endonuclease-like (RecB) superfamily
MSIEKYDGKQKKLYNDIVSLIEKSRHHVAREFNSTLVLLNWSIGSRINIDVFSSGRGGYGSQVIDKISDDLKRRYGEGYTRSNIFRMVQFSKLYPGKQIVATLSQQLSWSHLVELLPLEDENKRNFYVQMAVMEKWGVRTLRDKIQDMLYERTAISRKPEKLIASELEKVATNNEPTPDFVFHDPYFLNFTGLKDSYSEHDLENAILDNIVLFIQELGTDFCFVARQKRMSTKNKDRYLDLLFFHRGLKRLIAIELKLGSFEPEHKGQMDWYLRWLEKNECKVGEGKPLGIILCSYKDQEDIEYLELDSSGIHVAQYFTELPPRHILEEKLHRAIKTARETYNKRMKDSEQNERILD